MGQVQELLAAQREVEGQGFDIWGLWEGRGRKISLFPRNESFPLHPQVLPVYRSKEKLPLLKEMYKPKLKAEVAAAFVKRTIEMMKRKVNFTSRVTRAGQCFADSTGEGL